MESYKNPTWDSTESISVFINNVNEQVRNQISNFEARKKFISALYDNLGPSLEYDGSFYTKITFMFDFHTKEHPSCGFWVSFNLGDYPQKQPPITLTCIPPSCTKKGLKSVVNSSYPYSPRWSHDELANRIKTWISTSAIKTVNEMADTLDD